ncbi:methyl-accepting chemotaxis protein [Gammaproteobacteria bacterium AS21]
MKKLIITIVCLMFAVALAANIATTAVISKSEMERVILEQSYDKVSLLSEHAQYVLENSQQPITDMTVLVRKLKNRTDISYAILIDKNAQAVAHSDEQKQDKVYSDEYTLSGAQQGERQHSMWYAEVQKTWVYDVMVPVYVHDVLYGTFDVGVPVREVESVTMSIIISQILATLAVYVVCLIILFFLINRFLKPIHQMQRALEDISKGEGDLTARLPVIGKDEIAAISNAFNIFVGKIQEIIRQVSSTGSDLNTAASNLRTQSAIALDRGLNQNEETILAVSSMNEMSETINEIARNAANAALSADKASDETHSSVTVLTSANNSIKLLAKEMENMSSVVSALDEKTGSIGSILVVIKQISEQTNLLALNAAIEAARAGDAGRGFAVVADEVRNLASKTALSTEQIQEMIDGLQSEAKRAVDSMYSSKALTDDGSNATDKAQISLEEILIQINQISDSNTLVATATEEQSVVAVEIKAKMESVSSSVNEGLKANKELEKTSAELGNLSITLEKLVGSFKV